ncbi:MAG: sigma-70 family RNA polymerase sigma factor [Bacteroidota bacterium]
MKNRVDIQLIAACLTNDRKAQRQLYDLALPTLSLVCRRYLVSQTDLKDALQDTFISIFQHLDQYDVRRANFGTWANRIAINTCLKKNAALKRGRTVEFSPTKHGKRIDPEVLDKLSNEDLIKWLQQMPRPYYEVFSLYVIDGFSHGEIGELLHIDMVLSRKRLSRARGWLKKHLPNDWQTPLSRDYPLRAGLMMLPLAAQLAMFLSGP